MASAACPPPQRAQHKQYEVRLLIRGGGGGIICWDEQIAAWEMMAALIAFSPCADSDRLFMATHTQGRSACVRVCVRRQVRWPWSDPQQRATGYSSPPPPSLPRQVCARFGQTRVTAGNWTSYTPARTHAHSQP